MSKESPAIAASLDATLLAAIAGRDEAAMSRFFSRHSRLVYSVAIRVLRDSSAAEDVLQEIFMQIWRNPSVFTPTRGSLEGWLAVMARNRSIDVLRKRRPMDSIDDLPIASPRDFAAESQHNLTMERVREIVALLPAEQRHALELAFFEGLTHIEIAQRTGTPLGTIKTRIRSALHAVGKALQP